MKELSDVTEAWKQQRDRGESGVLATVVAVEGSSYRKPAARMLISADGLGIGSVSGGCLETDVAEHAERVLATGKPLLLTYDSRDDDDHLGVGTGCRGIVRILLEALEPGCDEPIALPAPLLGLREEAVLAVVYRADNPDLVGKRLLVRGDAAPRGSLLGCDAFKEIFETCEDVLESGQSATAAIHSKHGSVFMLCEMIRPQVSLVVCGAGADAIPLARLAAEMGWRVIVVDHRPAFARRERFPLAYEVIISRPEEIGKRIAVDSRTAIVVMTHNYSADCEYLNAAIESNAFYIGLLGSKERADRLRAGLEVEPAPTRGRMRRQDFGREMAAFHAAQSNLQRVLHAPIGLNIGAETPEEIAAAIVAQIVPESHRLRTERSSFGKMRLLCPRKGAGQPCPTSA